MDINNLREFIELAKRLNFTETARMLNVSQPTLSKHIGAFERSLKLELFNRQGNRLSLTRAGTELLPYAYRIIESQNEFQDVVKNLRTTKPPLLKIGGFVDEELVSQTLSNILLAMSEKYGRNFLEVCPSKHKLPHELLSSGEADIVFDYDYEKFKENDELDSAFIGSLRWVAVVNRDSDLAKKDSVSIEDLKDETLIKIEGSHISEAWQFVHQCCNAHGFEPKIKRHYSMRLTDLITAAAGLNHEVLILGENFMKRVGIGIVPFCQEIPIIDEDARFPVAAHFLNKTKNSLVYEAINILDELNETAEVATGNDKAANKGGDIEGGKE